jgi:ketosteroid isomerase-like protein
MGDADLLLRQAHETGYRFPPRFRGFTATLRTSAGDHGRLVVRGRSEIEVSIQGEPTDQVDWAREQIASVVGHRWPTGYDDGDGRWAKRADGDTVTILDDPFDSAYRLRDAQISEVHRTVGQVRFVIAISERHRVDDGRYLPAQFTVFHWSTESGRLVRAEHFTDTYIRIDGVYLPARRQVISATDEGLTTRVLDLAEHTVTTDG